MYCIVYKVFTPRHKALDFQTCSAVSRFTQIHERRQGYIHGGSREYGANTFTWVKHKLLRHAHE